MANFIQRLRTRNRLQAASTAQSEHDMLSKQLKKYVGSEYIPNSLKTENPAYATDLSLMK